MMNRTSAGWTLLVLACVVSFEHARAQNTPDPWYARQAKPRNIDPPKTFTNLFSIELPKDWQLAPGHQHIIFSVVERARRFEAGALITMQHRRLQVPLDQPLTASARDYELKAMQEYDVSGKMFTASVKPGPLGQFIFIQYLRRGLSGRDDHVTQYSFPIGDTLYRLVCIAPASAIEQYRPIFAHVAASFTPIKPAGS